MYLIEKDTELTNTKIIELLQHFNTYERPRLQRLKDYYDGKQAITRKPEPDRSLNKPCNRIVTNFCRDIVDNYTGYLTGQDITYSSYMDIDQIQSILNYNDVSSEDSELLKTALIYGVSYEVNYIDEEGQQRFAVLDSRECFPIYYNTLSRTLAAVIRYYLVDSTDYSKGYYVEVYTEAAKIVYRTNSTLSSLVLGEGENNYFDQIPITVFELNEDRASIFESIMSLQDAYNTLMSSEVDDFEAFCDAYLIIKGMDTANMTDEDWAAMRTNRVIDLGMGVGDGSDRDIKYLTKSINDTQIENMLDNIETKIHVISACPNFADEAFGTSSGIALKHKLLGFENKSSAIAKRMTKALQKRIELICSILTKINGLEAWRDIQIVFTKNLPVDMTDIVTEVNGLRGLVSDKTLLSQVPFVQDVDAEIEMLKEQEEQNMELYRFGQGGVNNGVLGQEDRQPE